MVRVLSAAAVASLDAEETDEVWLVLLTITHPDLTDTIRLVNNIENVESQGYTFIGLPFEIELPSEGERPGEARLKVDNVNREIVEAIRTIGLVPPQVQIQLVLASQPNQLEYQVPVMTLRDASYDVSYVSGVLRFEDITTEPVCDTQTPQRFPALF